MILLNICMLMFGVHHRFPLLMATIIIYFLSIILPSIDGFILCIISRMCLLSLSNLPLWLKISFLKKLKIFILTTVVNLSNLDLSLMLVVLVILPLHHILPNKMALLNAAIDILSTLVWPSYIMLRLLPLIGPMPWPRQFILLTVFPQYYTHDKVLLKCYLVGFLTIINCALLVVNAIHGLFRIVQINFSLNPTFVYFLGTPSLNMRFNV